MPRECPQIASYNTKPLHFKLCSIWCAWAKWLVVNLKNVLMITDSMHSSWVSFGTLWPSLDPSWLLKMFRSSLTKTLNAVFPLLVLSRSLMMALCFLTLISLLLNTIRTLSWWNNSSHKQFQQVSFVHQLFCYCTSEPVGAVSTHRPSALDNDLLES